MDHLSIQRDCKQPTQGDSSMKKPEKKPKCRDSDIEANAIADQAYDDGWDACIDAYELWEKERPATWIACPMMYVPIVICSNCGEYGEFAVYISCPGCCRRMIE